MDEQDKVPKQRFVWLLKQRGCSFWGEEELEKKIHTIPLTTRPDFYIEDPAGRAFIAEIKSFEKPGPLQSSKSSSRVMSSNPEDIYKRLRLAVKEAADQLRPYQELGIPMIVVLDNWRRVGIPSNILDLRNALFGTLAVRKKVHFDSPSLAPARWYHGKGRRLDATTATYISAVAWNLPKTHYFDERVMEEKGMYLRMIHNRFAKTPFPIEIFNNGDDEHYGYKESCWVKLSS